MALTIAQIETILVSRRSGYMSAADLAVTVVGTNADLVDPIGYAIRQVGGSVNSYGAVTDTDLLSVDSSDYDMLFDFAEYRLLLNLKGRYGKVDIKAGHLAESLSQMADQLKEDIATMAAYLTDFYGFGTASRIEMGVMSYDIADHDDLIDTDETTNSESL